ncbi:NAD(P)/FAD-dependent oxidoreductase [Phytohabitans rumicis]|uniref:Putative oxidoreductase n=1 Tax=Phytohabitans rumicis TaxID=1076125 RepID=A0A6V8L9Z8_9ACTN|nr:FAD-binding oxidoreductase [Phytohabitans rumicis]GFJ91611.1 putative oxidoreductase [Phytohabitans rumicis]
MTGVQPYGVSGWQRDLPPASPQPPLGADTDAQVAIVGAGLAGLALAHALTRSVPPGDILVIEAGRAGDGATGRSTGIVGPGVGGPIAALVRKRGPAVARRMFGASVEGVAALRRLVKDLPDGCELSETYQLVAAQTPGHVARLREQAETLTGLGFDVRYLDRVQTADRLGVDRYHGALCYPDVVTINPWRLCQVLKESLLAAGVRIAEQTRVTGVRGGDPAQVLAGPVRVRARRVVLTTDGFTRAIGVHQKTLATIRTHVARTEVLPPELLARTGWNGDGAVIDSRSFFNYFRLTPERRLLFGGGPALLEERVTPARVAAVRERVARELAVVFPALAGVAIEDFWAGVTASTSDRMPIVGPVRGQPGVWFAGGWSGHGLAMSAYTAQTLPALLDSGLPGGEADLPWLRPAAGWAPTGRMGRLLLSGYLAGLDAADRLATR